jgi:hypothetical protein
LLCILFSWSDDLGKGFDPGVFGRFDLAALAQPHLKFLFVCLFAYPFMRSFLKRGQVWSPAAAPLRPPVVSLGPREYAAGGAFDGGEEGRLDSPRGLTGMPRARGLVGPAGIRSARFGPTRRVITK